MSEKFEVKTGTMAVEVLGITNFSELKKILGEKAAQEVICKNSIDKKDILENVKHYKAIRMPLKKTRAEANKMLKLKSKEVLDEFDTAIQLVSDYIEPYEAAVNEYDEQNRVKKLERLRKKFIPEVEKINLQIEEINEGFGKEILSKLEFDEAWTNKSEKAIVLILNDFVDAVEKTKQQIENNILAVATKAESLKFQYDLQSELNYKLILGDRIYTDGLADLQDRLEDFAADQQRAEIEAAERAEAEAERKAEQERLRVEAEQKRKEREVEAEKQRLIAEQRRKDQEAERQKQIELQEAQEKARAEERAKIEKEQREEEARKNRIEENDRKLRQQKENKRIEDARVKIQSEENVLDKNEVTETNHGIERAKTTSRTIHFSSLTKAQMVKMLEFFDENNIKFEVI